MDYVFIIILQVVGFVSFQLPVLKSIDSNTAGDKLWEVIKIFWEKDKVTVLGSILILILQITVHAAIWYYDVPTADFKLTIPVFDWQVGYIGATLWGALILGAIGQALLYFAFGKTRDYVIDKFGKK